MTSRLVIAPANEPVTLSEAKAHLRVTSSAEDALIGGLVSAAVQHLDGEGVLGRAMITQTWATYASNTPGVIRLPMTPFQSLTSVEYYDSDNSLQAATLSDFEARIFRDFATIHPVRGAAWPTAYPRYDAFKITYVVGWGDAADVPQTLKQAILLLVGHWYEHRMAVTDDRLMETPVAVDALVGANRVGWYG